MLEGGTDETVAFVAGRIFAYASPPRSPGSHLDSRRNFTEATSTWKPIVLSSAEENAICGFMAEAGLSFGRFDFIRKDGILHFLEVNPNGQWAWLDERNEYGLISAVAEAVLAVERRGRSLADS